MKKKIVINVPIHSAKGKSRAMKIAVAIHGVILVSVGAENEQLEVIGEGVDSVHLVNSLTKKFCFADIVSLEEVKPRTSPPATASTSPESSPPKPCPPPPFHYCPPFYYEQGVYDAAPPNCSII